MFGGGGVRFLDLRDVLARKPRIPGVPLLQYDPAIPSLFLPVPPHDSALKINMVFVRCVSVCKLIC